jgi:hypothetical protein
MRGNVGKGVAMADQQENKYLKILLPILGVMIVLWLILG